MPSPKDDYDDAFFSYVADMALQANGMARVLAYIKDHLGQVCPEFEVCGHASCGAACSSWLLADQALRGDYRLPGDPVQTQEDRLTDF